MTDYPLNLDEIGSWLRTVASASASHLVTPGEIRQGRSTNKPSACADFDSDTKMGRISAWVSGEIDFEVLRISDGGLVLCHHENVPTLSDPSLEKAVSLFFDAMSSSGASPANLKTEL